MALIWHERKINNFDPYSVLLAIATNIPQRLKTGFVVQSHIYKLQMSFQDAMDNACQDITAEQ